MQNLEFDSQFLPPSPSFSHPRRRRNRGLADLLPSTRPISSSLSSLSASQWEALWPETQDQVPPDTTGAANISSDLYFGSLEQHLATDAEQAALDSHGGPETHDTGPQSPSATGAGVFISNTPRLGEYPSNHQSRNSRQAALAEGKYACEEPECPKKRADGSPPRFGSSADLIRHALDVHHKNLRTGSPIRLHYCGYEDCSRHTKGFVREDNLKNHMSSKHKNQKPSEMRSILSASGSRQPRRGSPRVLNPVRQPEPAPAESTSGQVVAETPSDIELPSPLTNNEKSDPVLWVHYCLVKSNRELVRLKQVELKQWEDRRSDLNRRLIKASAEAQQMQKTIAQLEAFNAKHVDQGDQSPFFAMTKSERSSHRARLAEIKDIQTQYNDFLRLEDEIAEYRDEANESIRYLHRKRKRTDD